MDWRTIWKMAVAVLMCFFVGTAAAVEQCGGRTSKGNPFPCCESGGNCTWWAWDHATRMGWLVTPMGNANSWDDFARLSPAFVVSKTPTPNSIGVKESAPYTCGSKVCDTGHVAVITGFEKDRNGNVKGLTTSQMACGGAYGVTTPPRALTYFDAYISKVDLNGKAASTCNDGAAIASSTSAAGDMLKIFYSPKCATKWAQVVAKTKGATTSAAVSRSDGLTKTGKGTDMSTTTMVETGTKQACAAATVKVNSKSTTWSVCK